MTLHGDIQVTRRYVIGTNKEGSFPVDAALGLDEHGVSPGAREVACRLGMEYCFRQVADDARRFVGLTVGRELLRGIVEREGARIMRVRDSGVLPARFTAADCLPDPTKDPTLSRIYAGVDGVFVPVISQQEKAKRRAKSEQRRALLAAAGKAPLAPLPPMKPGHSDRYKEMKLVVFYGQNKDFMHVAVTGGDCHIAGALLGVHAAQVQMQSATETVSLTDGAVWIIIQLDIHLPFITAKILDNCHLKQHVHAASERAFRDRDEANTWTDDRMREFKEAGAVVALAAFAEARDHVTTQAGRDGLDGLIGYASERVKMLGYKEALAKGWDIGSGPTESNCKTHARRLKISGGKWDTDNPEKMMNLIALKYSGQWEAYWSRLAA